MVVDVLHVDLSLVDPHGDVRHGAVPMKPAHDRTLVVVERVPLTELSVVVGTPVKSIADKRATVCYHFPPRDSLLIVVITL